MFDSRVSASPAEIPMAETSCLASGTVTDDDDPAARAARRRRIAVLADDLTALAGQLNAGLARFLLLLGEFDEEKGWVGDGVQSLAHWLGWRCGVGQVAAREQVRVARVLPGLPQIRAAFQAGQLSYSKVRAMTRVATGANEEYFLMIARHGTAAHLERLARGYRQVRDRAEDADAAARTYERRTLALRPDWDAPPNGETVVRVQGVLPAEGAAIVEQALEVLMEATYREEHPTAPQDESSERSFGNVSAETFATHRGQRRADALVRMAEQVLAQPPFAPDAGTPAVEVRLHVDAATLAFRDGTCELEGPHNCRYPLHIETARRLSCDAARVTILKEPAELGGEPLAVGRRTRTIPPAIQRALHARDGRCRFAGCTRVAHLHGHHIRHWAEGGETSLENLVQLCGYHHRLVHEQQFSVHALPGGGFEFRRPDGEVLGPQPTPHTVEWMDLVNTNRHYAIDESTIVPRGHDHDMDYDIAIQALLRRDGLLQAGSAQRPESGDS